MDVKQMAGAAPEYALEAMDVLRRAGKQAYLVGGFVRDVLLGRPPHDVDVATDSLWYVTRDIFRNAGYAVAETGTAHGTVTVVMDGQPVEITTFRTEGSYMDHRRPSSVRFVSDIREDLARRDFTMNALAWNPEEGLVDPFGGLGDIARGAIKAVGDPCRRFDEDALRVIRAVRFRAQLGFHIEERTALAVHRHAEDLSLVSVERVAQEYDRLVRGPYAVEALREYPDVAAQAVPEIASMVGFDQCSRWHRYDVWEHCLHALGSLPAAAPPCVRHAVLLHDIGKPRTFVMGQDGNGHFYGHEEVGARLFKEAYRRLRWSSSELRVMEYLIRHHDGPIDPTPRGIRRALAKISACVAPRREDALRVFDWLLQLKYADTVSHAPRATDKRLHELALVREGLEAAIEGGVTFCLKDLALNGSDVVSLGVPAGPRVGSMLRAALGAVVDGEVENDHAALMEYARRHL